MSIKMIVTNFIKLLFIEVVVFTCGLIGCMGTMMLISFLNKYIEKFYKFPDSQLVAYLPLFLGVLFGLTFFSYLTFHWLLTGTLKQILLILTWKSSIDGKNDKKEDFKTAYIKRGKQS
jgi:hypothetical protein